MTWREGRSAPRPRCYLQLGQPEIFGPTRAHTPPCPLCPTCPAHPARLSPVQPRPSCGGGAARRGRRRRSAVAVSSSSFFIIIINFVGFFFFCVPACLSLLATSLPPARLRACLLFPLHIWVRHSCCYVVWCGVVWCSVVCWVGLCWLLVLHLALSLPRYGKACCSGFSIRLVLRRLLLLLLTHLGHSHHRLFIFFLLHSALAAPTIPLYHVSLPLQLTYPLVLNLSLLRRMARLGFVC